MQAHDTRACVYLHLNGNQTHWHANSIGRYPSYQHPTQHYVSETAA